MTNFEMTLDETAALARYIHLVRKRLGHQHTWDKPGIEDALTKARGIAPSPDLAIAAIRAAKVPGNRTPAVIGLQGPHWRTTETAPHRPPVPVTHRCSVCDNTQEVCEVRWSGDHTYDPRELRAVRVKAPETPDPTRPEHQTVQTLKELAHGHTTYDPPTVDGNPAAD